jgi:2-keto-3-deoxy-L-rhamnonate aldolase RhmA
MKRAGFDWLWVDNEHAAHSYNILQDVVRCADDVGLVTLLRVAQNHYPLIAQALDIGATGIIVPRLETAEEVRYALDCAKYPPLGRRGFGMRSQLFGVNEITMKDRVADQNDRIFVFQIESRKGVENIDAMLDVAAGLVDIVIFGPADFQMDIGKPDCPNDPELDAAARKVAAGCKRRNISTCLPVQTMEAAHTWLDRGYNIIAYGTDDSFLSDNAEQSRNDLRGMEKLLR